MESGQGFGVCCGSVSISLLDSKSISHAYRLLPSEQNSILKSELSLRDSLSLIHLLTIV